jgi:Nucleoside 2-deoxyribosyltransferase like
MKDEIMNSYIEMIEEKKSNKVFLGGTCNGSKWRDTITPLLTKEVFNPVVADWTPECQQEEQKERKECSTVLYVITPKMTGSYSIAEVIDDSNKRPERTVFVGLKIDSGDKFTEPQWKSLQEVSKMVVRNGGKSFDSLEDAAKYINGVK